MKSKTSQNKMKKYLLGLCAICLLSISSCKTTDYGYAVKGEKVNMKVQERPDAINYQALKNSDIPTLADRADRSRGGSRGLPFVGGAVSLATNAIKKMIANDRKKYTAAYSIALTDLYFYDQLSSESSFDPVGMQFSGFTLLRTFINREGSLDTAFTARFALDTTRPDEIINNSIFRLRLVSLDLDHTKAKMTKAQKNTINMDIEITVTTSYVNEMGQLFDKVELGKFVLLLRDAPMDRNSPDYAPYYAGLKGKLIDGKSFIVPRSFGYHMNAQGVAERSFSQGAYSITARISESSKDRFVTTILVDNSSKIVDMLGGKAKSALEKEN